MINININLIIKSHFKYLKLKLNIYHFKLMMKIKYKINININLIIKSHFKQLILKLNIYQMERVNSFIDIKI
jgi:hypothetical protein